MVIGETSNTELVGGPRDGWDFELRNWWVFKPTLFIGFLVCIWVMLMINFLPLVACRVLFSTAKASG